MSQYGSEFSIRAPRDTMLSSSTRSFTGQQLSNGQYVALQDTAWKYLFIYQRQAFDTKGEIYPLNLTTLCQPEAVMDDRLLSDSHLFFV